MAYGDIETFHRDGKWLNRADGVGLLSTHDDRRSAITFGRRLAQLRHAEHRLKDADGNITEVRSHRRVTSSESS